MDENLKIQEDIEQEERMRAKAREKIAKEKEPNFWTFFGLFVVLGIFLILLLALIS